MENRLPDFENLYNTRDLGGMPAFGGRSIRAGMLIRSGYLLRAAENDLAAITDAVSDVVDLRTDREADERPDPPLAGVTFHRLPVLPSLTPGITHEKGADRLMLDRMIADRSGEAAKEYMCALYRGFVTGPFCRRQYAAFVRLLLRERPRALLWHCTAGKDRAGFAAMIAEKLLGVADDVIRADYLETNDRLDPEIRAQLAAADAPVALPWLFTAREEYYDALTEALRQAGGFESYLREGLGVTEEMHRRLRERYLE